ncbi:MAG: hypothetical protein HDR24_03750 [Lachnospiraceae bacterium]|nr:hypothetical protein [Lachnospiraceae bacterium]MDE7444802.1 hypothetical protein [Lachnospiraceae bacterium]
MENSMCVHDLIVEEFEHTKSLSALVYLIERGRELEFSIHGKGYFISRSKSQKYVSLWDNQSEQSFNTVEELIESAIVADSILLSVLSEIKIETIF